MTLVDIELSALDPLIILNRGDGTLTLSVPLEIFQRAAHELFTAQPALMRPATVLVQ